MKKILLAILLVMTLSCAEEKNTIKIEDGTDPELELLIQQFKESEKRLKEQEKLSKALDELGGIVSNIKEK